MPTPRVNIVLHMEHHSDNQKYNLSIPNEVAMAFQNDDDELSLLRVVRISPRNDEQPFVSLNILSTSLDPMTYPTFYRKGKPG